jgi:hypothetical protein
MNKLRLWRVEAQNSSGLRAPSLYVETSTPRDWSREVARLEAVELAKEMSGLGRFPETWNFIATHLESKFVLSSNGWEKWVDQGVYRLEHGRWTRKRPDEDEED